MLKRLKNQKGFTLVELIVVICILGFVLTSISGFLLANIKAFNTAEQQVEAQTQAQYALNGFIERCIGTKGITAITFDEFGVPYKNLNTVNLLKSDGSTIVQFDFADGTLSVTEGGTTTKLADYIETFEILPIAASVLEAPAASDYSDISCRGVKVTVVAKMKESTVTLTSEVYFRNK